MAERFDHGFVGVVERHVLADDGDADFAVRVAERLRGLDPMLQIGGCFLL
jgi:hypothetical protein